MLLAVLAIVAFVIAAILKLVHHDPSAVTWLIIIGGILICAHALWGWAAPRYWRRPAA